MGTNMDNYETKVREISKDPREQRIKILVMILLILFAVALYFPVTFTLFHWRSLPDYMVDPYGGRLDSRPLFNAADGEKCTEYELYYAIPLLLLMAHSTYSDYGKIHFFKMLIASICAVIGAMVVPNIAYITGNFIPGYSMSLCILVFRLSIIFSLLLYIIIHILITALPEEASYKIYKVCFLSCFISMNILGNLIPLLSNLFTKLGWG